MVKDEPLVLREIGLLQKLRKLKVLLRNVKVNWKAFVGSLGKLACSLHSLSIHIIDEKEHVTNFSLVGKLDSLPPWISSLRSVSRFTLRETGLHAEAIPAKPAVPQALSQVVC